MQIVDLLFNWVAWPIIFLTSSLWLYQGGYALATRSFAREAKIRMILALLICIGFSGYYWTLNYLYSHTKLSPGTTSTYSQLPQNWGEDSPPADREENSRIIASIAFVESNQLLKYVDRSGDWKEYCPTLEDAKRIRQKAELRTASSIASNQSFNSAIRVLVFGVVALLLGFIKGRSATPINSAFR
ncbi:hypothetical protein [Parvibium lacunae]|uniref:Uncharacterized protein n=1 Tax=Parvibium lacunae TaxID=1888893 RepID=A0A368L7A6_9BURK|nr:hypothetical protein [Parvibium lacunae]RCS59391.1 hypothetical protein DU000_01255 [Parvibium lacunae]